MGPTHQPDAITEFQRLLDEWAAAIVANDADQIDTFVDPGWQLVTPEGGPVARERFLSIVRDGSMTHSQMAFEVLSVRLHGDTAVVVAHGTNQGEWQGQGFSADEWVTEIFVRCDTGWRCILSALTPNFAAQPEAPAPD